MPPLFRGTTEGYSGSPGLQAAGVTPTSTSAAVATVFGTSVQHYGDGIVQIALPGSIAEIDIIPRGNASAGSLPSLESEVGVNMPPTQFADQVSVTVTTTQARTILQGMGIKVPANLGIGDISPTLTNLPQMTPAQIQQFINIATKASGH